MGNIREDMRDVGFEEEDTGDRGNGESHSSVLTLLEVGAAGRGILER